MSAHTELKKLLKQADAIPFRRVGKVRAAHNPKSAPELLKAVFAAVQQFAPALVDEWGEPNGNCVGKWREEGLSIAFVCDDPIPRDVNPVACPISWLVERCPRYHFRLAPAEPDSMRFEALDDWDIGKITPLLPGWFVSACKERRAEIVAHVQATARESSTPSQPEGASEDSEGERCELCAATLYTTAPEVQQMCHMILCPYWTPGIGPDWMPKERESAQWKERRKAG